MDIDVFYKIKTNPVKLENYINYFAKDIIMGKISIDAPISEILMRRYEKPINLKERMLVRKLCLSLGLLQPGDSRDVIVDVFYVLLKNRMTPITCDALEKNVISLRKKYKLPLLGVTSSNIRRQLKRLRTLYLVDKLKTKYKIAESASLREIFSEKIEKFVLSGIIHRVYEYLDKIDQEFPKERKKAQDSTTK